MGKRRKTKYRRRTKKLGILARTQKALMRYVLFMGLGALVYAGFQHPAYVQKLAKSFGLSNVTGKLPKLLQDSVSKIGEATSVSSVWGGQAMRDDPVRPKVEFYNQVDTDSGKRADFVDSASRGFILRIGSFAHLAACESLQHNMQKHGFISKISHFQSDEHYKCSVFVGPYASMDLAYQAKNELYRLGFVGILKPVVAG